MSLPNRVRPTAQIASVDWNVSPPRWEALLMACREATYFHTNLWLEALEQGLGAQLARTKLTFTDGNWALLPLCLHRFAGGYLPLAIAGETGVYGALVSPRGLEEHALTEAFERVRQRYRSARVWDNPFARSEVVPRTASHWQPLSQSTHWLPLAPPEQMWAAFSRGCKARCNKARRLGVRVTWQTDAAAVAIFDRLYRESIQRWGPRLTWERPAAFFQAVVSRGDGNAQVAIAWREATPVAAMIFLHHGEGVHYLAGASATQEREAAPANALLEAALARYWRAGARYLDLGPSQGLEGVRQFKSSFGAQERAFSGWETIRPATRAFLALRYGLGRLHHRSGGS
ncbi:MAG: GNAT family N-acetyltransferase [Candidatus Sericytochromatia bacterium]|nr:GNAT family N-acetyltransferase [Candidatus Sericytochromatia bacterium]